jgi:DUF4097 and DUF4098 domain-containing protein YvlB
MNVDGKILQRRLTMKEVRLTAVVLCALLLAAGWVVGFEGYQETIDKRFPLSVGGTVSLENVNGDVTIEVWENSEVWVQAVKSASSQELLDGLEVEIDASSSAVRIDTKYPSTRRSKHAAQDHEKRERGSFTKVEYTLTIPRTAVVDEVDLVNGNLMIVGVEGGVEAETVNGNIVVREGAGDASLSTVNGDIELHADRLGYGESIDLESVNGALDLYLAASAGAEIRAESLNGRLRNDFGIEVRKGKYVGSDLKGNVGGGGALVNLETVNGSITVHSF